MSCNCSRALAFSATGSNITSRGPEMRNRKCAPSLPHIWAARLPATPVSSKEIRGTGYKMTTTEAQHRIVETDGIRMHIAEQGTGPTVLLCHGFPECWYSWRHQLSALAASGFHAIAPDMRGYGQTEAPPEIERYTLLHHLGDMVGLLDAL